MVQPVTFYMKRISLKNDILRKTLILATVCAVFYVLINNKDTSLRIGDTILLMERSTFILKINFIDLGF